MRSNLTEPNKTEFVRLIQENKGIIFKVCTTYCNNKPDLDDLSQEIVYNLWKSYNTYNADLKFTTWMYRIALNVAISFYRKDRKSRNKVPFTESLMEFEEPAATDSQAETQLNLLRQFINELKEIDKSIMLLYLEDKSYREIAEITGISETYVATKINRIKLNLRAKFQNT